MQWLVGMLLAAATAYVTTALTIDNVLNEHAALKEHADAPHCDVCGASLATAEDRPLDSVAKESSPVTIRLRSQTEEPIPVAKHLPALRRLSDALEWNWTSEVGRLIGAGEVMLAPHDTLAELLEEETFYSKIRFRDALGATRVGYLISDSYQRQFIKLDAQN